MLGSLKRCSELLENGMEERAYVAACAIIDGKVDLSCLTDEAIKRPQIVQLIQRINKVERYMK